MCTKVYELDNPKNLSRSMVVVLGTIFKNLLDSYFR